ncbi:MAG TPA: hypothetical protein VK153_03515 [Candidatus Paceibacterota bacterium]|nr:hypothetical protein [Candidatus Paceibacterota bacterium]
MKKQTVVKIIGSVLIFTFAMFFVQAVSPSPLFAANELNWENPNKNGKNPYAFKPSNVLNSQLMMQVVGCTGVVDKVSTAITDFAAQQANEFLTSQLKSAAKVAICKVGKVLGITAVASIPYGNLTDVTKEIPCNEIQQTTDVKLIKEAKETRTAEEAAKKREECFNGIAVTLARNQLTAMTRYTMNWVNTGFNGDPMYVRDITSFTNSLERNVLETGINKLTNTHMAYPYGTAFSRTAINSYKAGSSLRSGATNFLDSLTSDLANFITDPNSYYSNSEELTVLEKSKRANDAFSDDFAVGGWDGWLALTQRDQNNPLGFAMQVSQYLGDQQTMQVQNTKDELLTNDGFLSQKRCVLWELYEAEGVPIYAFAMDQSEIGKIETSESRKSDFDKCKKYEVVTPGSLIKDKLSTYVNSPERQLELVDTINESLNALFSSLISKFQHEGLSSISSESYTDENMGGNGTNTVDLLGDGSDLNVNVEGINGSTSSYSNGSFDITRDLGNTFIHNYVKQSQGNWDAEFNVPELKIGVAPLDGDGNPMTNVYYTVTRPGKTILVENGANDWQIGDRAFWNGSEWQNWKKDVGGVETNPIKKRGIIQIQKDFITAAKEMLATLPSIMPRIGELDYCIPGPNPNWQTNSGEAEVAFTDLAGTMAERPLTRYRCNQDKILGIKIWRPIPGLFSSTQKCYKCCINGAGFTQDNRSYTSGYTFSTALEGEDEYDTYYNIFKDTLSSWWDDIENGNYWESFRATHVGTSLDPQQIINDAVKKVKDDLKAFHSIYSNHINSIYGKNGTMQREYLEYENRLTDLEADRNPEFLSMASEGLDITKDIVSYNENITELANKYKDSIVKANTNINKLSLIKKEVSRIIVAAQERREAKIREEQGLSAQEYIEKYKTCLDEETISYYDDLDIIDAESAEERCNDNMDNDLDGLVDDRDPDCSGYVNPNTNNNNNGQNVPSTYYRLQSCQDGRVYGAGPLSSGIYSSGSRVQGGSGMYYVVTGSQTGPISGAVDNIGISATGQMGCPYY